MGSDPGALVSDLTVYSITFVYVCTCVSWYAQDSLQELALCSDQSGPKDLTQFLRRGSRHP